MDVFYLGTHRPGWLGRLDVPLCISHNTLKATKRLRPAAAPWVVDSGAYTELAGHGRWRTTPAEYAEAVTRYQQQAGMLAWAGPQDWLCLPPIRERTGLTVAEHQERTVRNLLDLRALAPDVPWLPTLQGGGIGDYFDCVRLYESAGVDLTAEPIVGVGSIAPRQDTTVVEVLITELHAAGLRLHGFGVKQQGLARYADHLISADSMAWSYNARSEPPLPGCTHRSCQNCPTYALRWRDRTVAFTAQQRLFT